eukprot:11309408-Ditylum_brightwellii.AAC.1
MPCPKRDTKKCGGNNLIVQTMDRSNSSVSAKMLSCLTPKRKDPERRCYYYGIYDEQQTKLEKEKRKREQCY